MSVLVTFTDTSTPGPSGPITAWAWDFGDGGTSTSQNPTHSYSTYGTYTVTLTVTGTSPDGTAMGSGTVTLVAPPSGGATAAFVSAISGLTVNFTDESTPGPSGPITAWAWDFDDAHTSASQNPSHTYAAGGTYNPSLTVTATSPDTGDTVSHAVTVSATPGPSGFPSALATSGRSIVDANGHSLGRLKGFNIQAAGWPQTAYNDIYAKGGRVLRLMVFWDSLEPTRGTINTSFVSSLDTSIARAQAAGLYVILCLYYGPNGVHKPSWLGGSQLHYYTDSNNGQNATQYLAHRYGNPSGAKYTKAVIGMGINEPTPDSSSNGYLATHLSEQHTMMTWFRTYAPAWIGIISCGYGGGCPLPNVSGSGHTTSFHSQTFAGAPNDPFSGMGNWLMDLHIYKEATNISSTTPSYDGRNTYGMPDGGQQIDVGSNPYPPSGVTRTQCQQFLTAFLASHVAYCSSSRANVPLIVGEWGWKPALSGGDNYAADFAAAAATAGAAMELQWDYNTSTSSDPWAARPGGSWQAATTAWMGAA